MPEVSAMEDPTIASGRKCGHCTLCCKVPPIAQLDKPHDQWCQHCDAGRGCRIYQERPAVCRGFYCDYLTQPLVGEHWYPARSKMILFTEPGGNRLAIYVDSSRPNAWREQPYYREIKHWAANAARDMRQVIVVVGDRSIAILPDEDVDLGHVSANDRIQIREVMHKGRLRLEVEKIPADDPRLRGVRMGEVLVRHPLDGTARSIGSPAADAD
jgi:hypothetical protein